MRVKKQELLSSLPPEWPEDLLPEIQARIEETGTKVVVLDDDPTGAQTVHDVPVLTRWSRDILETALADPGAVFYISINSRSLPLSQAQALNREVASNLQAAARATRRDFVVVSRSDSTLRGHYPGELRALAEGLDRTFDGTLIIPFFLEGGRLTIHDTHYVTEGEWMIPAGETEYARDPAFGYRHSNICAWVSEKHRGEIEPQNVASVSLEDIRIGGPETVAGQLSQVHDGQVCVVNAVTYRDMEVFVAGLLRAEAAEQDFIYRTAASFIRVRGGIAPRGLLTCDDLSASRIDSGGMVIVGSHVKKSTIQMRAARSLPNIVSFEVDVERLLDEDARAHEIKRVARRTNESLLSGRDVLIYTTRQVVTEDDHMSSLEIGRSVSSGLVAIVSRLSERPAWMIAKGGVTASDVAVGGLEVKRAQALGQVIPGVPVWRVGSESRWPGLVYVVFPGNVGESDALAEMVRILRGKKEVYDV